MEENIFCHKDMYNKEKWEKLSSIDKQDALLQGIVLENYNGKIQETSVKSLSQKIEQMKVPLVLSCHHIHYNYKRLFHAFLFFCGNLPYVDLTVTRNIVWRKFQISGRKNKQRFAIIFIVISVFCNNYLSNISNGYAAECKKISEIKELRARPDIKHTAKQIIK